MQKKTQRNNEERNVCNTGGKPNNMNKTRKPTKRGTKTGEQQHGQATRQQHTMTKHVAKPMKQRNQENH